MLSEVHVSGESIAKGRIEESAPRATGRVAYVRTHEPRLIGEVEDHGVTDDGIDAVKEEEVVRVLTLPGGVQQPQSPAQVPHLALGKALGASLGVVGTTVPSQGVVVAPRYLGTARVLLSIVGKRKLMNVPWKRRAAFEVIKP